jgi:hypothetical protein
MRLCLLLLLFPLGLFINELTVVNDLAHRRIRLRCNLNKIELTLESPDTRVFRLLPPADR